MFSFFGRVMFCIMGGMFVGAALSAVPFIRIILKSLKSKK